jgi:prophage regulatory protein
MLESNLTSTILADLKILTKKELREIVPYTPQHIHRLEKAGKFPRRLQLGANRVGWRLSDIQAWIEGRTPSPINYLDDEEIPY